MDHKRIRESNLIEKYMAGGLTEAEEEQFEDHLFQCEQCLERLHKEMEERDFTRGYILRKLKPPEETFFERHYFSCDQCFENLKETEQIILSVKDAAKRGVMLVKNEKKNPLFELLSWLKSPKVSPAFAILAAVILVLFYPAWRGIFTVSHLREEVQRLSQPQVISGSIDLGVTRSGERGTVQEIMIQPQHGSFILNFTILEKSIPSPVYNAEILNSNGVRIWQAYNLKGQGDYGVFSIICQNSFFEEGNYFLKVYEVNPVNNQVVNEFLFPFRITYGT